MLWVVRGGVRRRGGGRGQAAGSPHAGPAGAAGAAPVGPSPDGGLDPGSRWSRWAPDVGRTGTDDEKDLAAFRPIAGTEVILALMPMSVLKALVGFLTFLFAFGLRRAGPPPGGSASSSVASPPGR